ncbi:SMI1/KNR4 family protein [Alkalihalophilus marmarensis]|uniref:SMI1/KNR4 family protein n=1 Tax=Alkalihalophilus marmarensis TaxID=521377 RepID=UPI002DBBA157|nr:SMI1/KNR4 family protein [Alkalihalophilus marmarensis]MEC2072509.1 SMI1/KNR4 family protein [Alkalihalophilus marmarensis]
MCKQEIIKFINNYKETDDFTGGIDKSQIEFAQNELGLEFPDSYKWFLSTYGSGGLFGVDIEGVTQSYKHSVVATTMRFRDLGMNKDLIVIEDIDEYAYCLRASDMEKFECPVIAWNKIGGLDDYEAAKNFCQFLWYRLQDAREAWEEDY